MGALSFVADEGIAEHDVLDRLFAKRLPTEARCPERGDASLEQERARGWIVPRMLATRSGSFTKPGANETAALVAVGECSPFGFEAGGSKVLAVFDGSRLAFRSGEIFLDDIAAVSDFDLDGVDELVLTATGMGQGHVATRAEVVDVRGGRWHSRDLGVVAEDDRPTGEPDAGGREGVLVLSPAADGGFPALHVELRPR